MHEQRGASGRTEDFGAIATPAQSESKRPVDVLEPRRYRHRTFRCPPDTENTQSGYFEMCVSIAFRYRGGGDQTVTENLVSARVVSQTPMKPLGTNTMSPLDTVIASPSAGVITASPSRM